MANWLTKNVEEIEKVKDRYDNKFREAKQRINKCETTLRKIMEHSHKIVESLTDNMNTLVAKLEKLHRDKFFVDLDQEIDLGIEDTSSPSKRMRESTKNKTTRLP